MRKVSNRYPVAVIALLMILSLVSNACKEDQVKETARLLNSIVHANKLLVDTTIQYHKDGLISTDDTDAVLKVAERIVRADIAANAVLRTVSGQMTAPTQQQLMLIIDSVLSEIIQLQKDLNIGDEKTRLAIEVALEGMETTANSIKLIVASTRSVN